MRPKRAPGAQDSAPGQWPASPAGTPVLASLLMGPLTGSVSPTRNASLKGIDFAPGGTAGSRYCGAACAADAPSTTVAATVITHLFRHIVFP